MQNGAAVTIGPFAELNYITATQVSISVFLLTQKQYHLLGFYS